MSETKDGAELTQCDGKWFARHGLTVLWADDEVELSDLLDLLDEGKPACIGEGYDIFNHRPTGREVVLPSNESMTDQQRGLVHALLMEAIKEHTSS